MTTLVNLGTTVAIARALTVRSAGVFFTATSLFLLVESVVVFGATTGLVYFVSRGRATARHDIVRGALRAAFRTVVPLAVVVAALGWLWIAPLGRVLAVTSAAPAGLLLFMCALPLAAINDLALAGTVGFHTMRPTVLVEGVGRPLLQLVLVLALLPTGDPVLLALAWATPYLLSSLAAVAWLRKLLAADPAGVDASPDAAAESSGSPGTAGRFSRATFWRFTAPRGLSSVAQTSMQRLDIVLVGLLAGPRDAALYTAATRFLVVSQLIQTSIGTAAQPRLAAWFALHDITSVARTYRTATAWVVLLAWPFLLTTAWLAPYWLKIFGGTYGGAAPVVVILAAAMIVSTGCGMVTVVLVMAGHTIDNLINTVVALVLFIGLDLALIPRLGITGAAIGWAAAIVAANLMPLTQNWRRLRIHPFGRQALLAMAITGGSFLLIPAAARALLGTSLATLVGACVVAGVLAAVLVIRNQSLFELGSLRRSVPRS